MKKIPFLKEGCVFKQIDDTTKGTEFKGAKIPLIEDGCIVGFTELEEAAAETVEKIVEKEVIKEVVKTPAHFIKGKLTKNTWASIFSTGYNKAYVQLTQDGKASLVIPDGTIAFYATCNNTKDCYFTGNAWKLGTTTTTITGENDYITFAIDNIPLCVEGLNCNTSATKYKWFGITTDVVIGGTRYAGDGFIRISLEPNSSNNGFDSGTVRFGIKNTCAGITKNEVNLKGKKVEFYLPNDAKQYQFAEYPVKYE